MNMKYIYVVSMLVVAMISIGCVDKTSEKVLPTDIPTQSNMPTITDVPDSKSSPEIVDNVNNVPPLEVASKHDNTSLPGIADDLNNKSSSEVTNKSGNTSSSEVVDTSDNISGNTSGNTSSSEVTDATTEDTSITEIFKIGDEKNVLGVNIKLVNITDYDNNTVILLMNGTEYKYDSTSDIIVKSNDVEVIDVIALPDDKMAEITVDYIKP